MKGISLAKKIREQVAESVCGEECLAVLLAGDDPGSLVYVNKKQEACHEVGIKTILCKFESKCRQQDIIDTILKWNNDKDIHGILIQLPLPRHLDQTTILNSVAPEKDVDGFNAINLGKLMQGKCGFVPCTPLAIVELLDHYNIPLEGKSVAVVNRSIVVGQPLSALLTQRNATVTICHEFTRHIDEVLRDSDLIVTAVGKRDRFVLRGNMVKPGSVVIDLGFNRLDNKVIGDAEFGEVSKVAGLVTPPVGGVGPVTIAVLLRNVLRAYSVLK